ncbi:MAG: hypothetical protein CMN31_21635 [Sandaracinus sp.]|nr:hypothetical protein [Sandaracinus sp.]MBJ73892.1 hypothetical protein [Sandaracinus sp.]
MPLGQPVWLAGSQFVVQICCVVIPRVMMQSDPAPPVQSPSPLQKRLHIGTSVAVDETLTQVLPAEQRSMSQRSPSAEVPAGAQTRSPVVPFR